MLLASNIGNKRDNRHNPYILSIISLKKSNALSLPSDIYYPIINQRNLMLWRGAAFKSGNKV